MGELRTKTLLEDARLLFGLTFAGAVIGLLGPLVAYDLWWHLKAGELIVRSGAVPHVDVFSFTAAGRPWTYHSWLSGVLFRGMHRLGGLTGLVMLRVLLIAGSLMISWVIARRRGVGAGLASVLVLIACLQLRARSLARPYLFSFILFVVFAAILQSCADAATEGPGEEGAPFAETDFLWGRGGRLALLPVLTLAWVNLHAGFLAGILLLGAFGVGELFRIRPHPAESYGEALWSGSAGARFRSMFLAGLFCMAFSLATPYGSGTLSYPFRLMAGVRLLARIREWEPMPLSGQYAVFWVLLVFGLLVMLRSIYFNRRLGHAREVTGEFVTDVLLLGGFAILALRSQRHLAWVLLLTPPILGRHLDISGRHFPGERMRRASYSYLALLLAVVVAALPFIKGPRPRAAPAEAKLPVRACNFMAERDLRARMYNTYEWGGYLIWRFWPEMRVFIDGRCLVYGDETIGAALRVARGEDGWREVLDAWGVDMLVVRYRKRPSEHLFADGTWRCVYWDDVAVVAIRRSALRKRWPDLPTFDASNPVLFAPGPDPASIGRALEEVEVVLRRDPACWTALAMRARLRVRAAEEEPGRRAELLQSAFLDAREAVRLREGSREAWKAMAESAAALGKEELAERARNRVEEFRRESR